MNLWSERDKAVLALAGELEEENGVIDRSFQQLEYLAQALPAVEERGSFGRVTGMVAAKGRALGQATWSLMLDSLAQEAGATARVWLEAIELLTYLHQDPSRVAEILEDRLPPAGNRAKAIKGFAKPLRDQWNESAAHLGTDPYSWSHMFNWRTGRVKTRFTFSAAVLRHNMELLFAMLIWNIQEAAKCLYEVKGPLPYSLTVQIDALKNEGLRLFGVDVPKTDLGGPKGT